MSNQIERDARVEAVAKLLYETQTAYPWPENWREPRAEQFRTYARAVLAAADAVGGEAHTAADVLRYAKGDEALTSWLGRTLVPAVVDEGSWDHLKLQLEAIAWDQKLNLEDALATVDEFVRDYSRPHSHPAPAVPADAAQGGEAVPFAWVWRRKGTDSAGVYFEDPASFIRKDHPDYEWHEVYTHPAPAPAVPESWRALAERCLTSMRAAVHYGETREGRPPQQTCLFEIRDLEAMLSAAPKPEAVAGWQPISTAPKGFGLVDIMCDGRRYAGCHYDRICDEYRHITACGVLIRLKGATHWMPLPAAPQEPTHD